MGYISYQNEIYSHTIVKHRKYTDIHYHDNYELYFLVDGATKYFIGNEIFTVHKGDFVFVPKGVLHKTDSENCLYNNRILISFDDAVFNQDMQDVFQALCTAKIISIDRVNEFIFKDLLKKIEKEYKEGAAHYKPLIKSYIRELLILLIRHKKSGNQEKKEEDEFFYAVQDYIVENFNADLSLRSLSKCFYLSESTLSRKFKNAFGMNLVEYINYIRILNAEKMLVETNKPVSHIAELCGFQDSNYFSTVFKRIIGKPPMKYRKEK